MGSKDQMKSIWIATLGCMALPFCLIGFAFIYGVIFAEADSSELSEEEGTAKAILVLRESVETISDGALRFADQYGFTDPERIKAFFSGHQVWADTNPPEVPEFVYGEVRSQQTTKKITGKETWEITINEIYVDNALELYVVDLEENGWEVDKSLETLVSASHKEAKLNITVTDFEDSIIINITSY